MIHVWWKESRYGRERQECWTLSCSNKLKATGLWLWSWRCFTRLHQIYYVVLPACSYAFPCALNPTACNACGIAACKCLASLFVFLSVFCPDWFSVCWSIWQSSCLSVFILCTAPVVQLDAVHVSYCFVASINQSFHYFILLYSVLLYCVWAFLVWKMCVFKFTGALVHLCVDTSWNKSCYRYFHLNNGCHDYLDVKLVFL